METHFEGATLKDAGKVTDRGILYDLIKRNGGQWVGAMLIEILFELTQKGWRHKNDNRAD